ncbi:hypothetical protein AJ79_00448 [Helicocarpus griseus UAMH5409]|uniref:Uncharacterized protein n=1 Tax=Helicocarpus griseus UAMH5409 TaxID=1447875 RepID=A0A2B7YBF9_9EURO|nr:hypothetical protein AJ79_00448 [Helicocarpus griseus UAMH5409]
MPDGPPTRTPRIDTDFFLILYRNANALSQSVGRIRQPDMLVNEQIGSNRNPVNFVILHEAVNAVKGRIERFYRPISESVFHDLVRNATAGDEQDNAAFRVHRVLRQIEREIPQARG